MSQRIACHKDQHIWPDQFHDPETGYPLANTTCQCGRYAARDDKGSIVASHRLWGSPASGRCPRCYAPWDDHPMSNCGMHL